MRPRLAVSLALRGFALVALLLITALASEAQVKIFYPTEGSTVHGIVTVEATKSDPGDGWIAFRVLPTDQKYLMATTAPARFEWDTQARDERGKQIYPDGQYTIEAAGYDGSGREQGKASVKLRVRNTIAASELGGRVLLRAHFNRADVFLYEMEATQVVDVPGKAGDVLRNPPEMSMGGGMGGPPMMGGGMGGGMGMEQLGIPTNIKFAGDARWTAEVLTPSVTGRAIVDYDLKRGYYLVSWLWPKKWNLEKFKMESNVPDSYTGWLPGAQVARPLAGQFYRFKVYANGELVQMHEDDEVFPMGQFYVELPSDPVGPGSTWEGEMAMITGLTDEETSLVSATFKLEGFEYFKSYRCARISATHTETNVQIPWDLPGNPVPSTAMGMGGAPGMGGGPPALGGPGGMGPAGGAMMPGPPGMAGGMGGIGGMGSMGMMQRGPDGEPSGTLKGDVTITRIAYFAIDAGRFVAFEDTVKKRIKKILAPPLMMMGMGGMGMGGMMGGGMGMGGMGGMGMMQKLEYRDLYHVDVEPFLGALVGAAGGGMMGGGMGMGMGGMGGIGAPPPMGGMGIGAPPPMGGMGAGAMPWTGGMGAGMGGMGGGMGMMQPPVKATVNIDTTLKVREVRQIAGHAVAQEASY